MGTRNLICVYHRGRFVIAQYSLWGHPESQGLRILKFLWGSGNIERLKEGLQNVITLTDEGLKQLINTMERDFEAEKSSYHGSRHMTADEKIIALWPSLSRNTGAKVLEIVAQATAENNVPIVQSLDLATHGHFCEWLYVVDLDQNTFEVFKGYEHKQQALTTRFIGVGRDNDNVPALIKSFSLSQLPTEDEFINALDKAMTERKYRLLEELAKAGREGAEIEGDEDEQDEDGEDEGEGENSEAGNNEKEVDKKEGTGDFGNTNDAMEADK
ncbi:hypothetical protein V8E54_008319 [Elaphomyces granulatus]